VVSETATHTGAPTRITAGNWKAGVAAGLAGALPFGFMMALLVEDPIIAVAIPSMYGLAPPANELAGFFVHMSHGAVLGVVFAGLLGLVGLTGASARTQVGAGLGFGVAVWLVLAVVVMPIWLGAVGSPANPPLPNVSVPSLVGHAVYRTVLGAAYYALEDL
jgi:uncharacterized membrane protein YagU involved in acid resistance